MDGQLFDTGGETASGREELARDAPLAVRMRPRSLDEVIGQGHVLGEGSALRTAIESGKPHSAILYGPPGAGKTTLARIAASGAQGAFEEQSAVNAGKAEIRAVIERARERRKGSGRPTILFLDEIHRFNKAQQDALLPAVEEGLLTLIGATTENPYFEVNSALLSRAQIYELRPLEPGQVEELLRRALGDPERGIAGPPAVSDAALEMLARRSGG
ncbi:MAG TPA: AAA family ATPase, partial [Solirubrobacterales bacterium]|nr:AAA family ATPase [Solirubrobacterales bacterium]